MLKGSFSLKTLRWFEVVVEVVDRFDQNDLVSVGEGYHSRMSVQIFKERKSSIRTRVLSCSYRKINAAVVDLCLQTVSASARANEFCARMRSNTHHSIYIRPVY